VAADLFSAEALRLLVASNRNMRNRAIHCGAMFAGSIAFVPTTLAALWFAAAMAAVLGGLTLANDASSADSLDARTSAARRLLAITVVNSMLYAAWSLLLSRSSESGAHLFATVMLFISMVYVLMQYYAAPRVFLLVAAPYLGALAAIAVWRVAPDVEAGGYWVVLSYAAGAVAVYNFLRGAQQALSQSRSALRQARALANEREAVAETAIAAKSAFLATMSHEIRTPLNGVLGMAQAMAAEGLPNTQRERLAVIQQSGETLLAILNDVLDLSKIEAGKLTLEACNFDLGELTSSIAAVFQAQAEERNLRFQLTIAEAARGWRRGDPTRVRQILFNLVSNALKFTPAGEIRVAITAIEAGIQISVADTGVGIAPDALEQLFDKFVQADASTTRRFGGTGLGLSICRELAHMMGGSITAASEVGKGSVFTVVLPLPPAPAASRVTREPDAQEADLTTLKVLAAEDNDVNQLVLRTLLGQIGLEPTIVGDGRQALEAWRRESWDLILMDVQMPEMDGLAATAAIRAEERETGRRRTPIVALTADALAHQTAACRAQGMDGHIAKPIEARRLFEALSLALAGPGEPGDTAAAAL
jgi:signal transduction histidine kinase/ActR/RegA family two-component response regulator